jgi:hypothetical protein
MASVVPSQGRSLARTQDDAPALTNREDEDEASGVIWPAERRKGSWSGH